MSPHNSSFNIMVNLKRLPLQTIQFPPNSLLGLVCDQKPCCPKLSPKRGRRTSVAWGFVVLPFKCLDSPGPRPPPALLLCALIITETVIASGLFFSYVWDLVFFFFHFSFFSAMNCSVSFPLSIINLCSKNLSKCLESKHYFFLFSRSVKTLWVKYAVFYSCKFVVYSARFYKRIFI